MTDRQPAEQPAADEPVVVGPPIAQSPPRRLRTIPALAIASILVAGGLLVTVGGMIRLVGPVAPTPTPTVAPTATPVPTVAPTPAPPLPTANPFGPSQTPHGLVLPLRDAV